MSQYLTTGPVSVHVSARTRIPSNPSLNPWTTFLGVAGDAAVEAASRAVADLVLGPGWAWANGGEAAVSADGARALSFVGEAGLEIVDPATVELDAIGGAR